MSYSSEHDQIAGAYAEAADQAKEHDLKTEAGREAFANMQRAALDEVALRMRLEEGLDAQRRSQKIGGVLIQPRGGLQLDPARPLILDGKLRSAQAPREVDDPRPESIPLPPKQFR